MKVLHVISDKNIGGAGVLLCTLLQRMDPARVQSLVALPKGSALCQRLEDLQIPVVELEQDCDRLSLASIKELSGWIMRHSPDILHANAALCARIAGRRCGIAVVHTRHCCFAPSGVWRIPPIKAIGGICNRALSDRVIATADAAAQNLLRMGISRKQIDVIINGSEPVRMVSEDALACCRREWRIEPNAFVVGICARLVACKGHETFLRAAKSILQQMPQRNFVFLIAGEGDRRAVLEDLASTLGVADRVRFLGFLSDTAPFYRLLNLNVNCSNGTETSCLAISEGMSAGVPALVSDYGGNAAMVQDSLAGIVYPVGDAEALASAVCRIASDGELEARMKAAAFRRYSKYYTASAMAERVMRVYEDLLK